MKKIKFKVNDKVIIKPYHEIEKERQKNDKLIFDYEMRKFCGEEVIISRIRKKSYGIIYYAKENDWWWFETWLTYTPSNLKKMEWFTDDLFEI